MPSRRRRIVLRFAAFLVAMLCVTTRGAAQVPASESQVKAAFIYNFLKFVDWPADAFAGPRDMLIVGIIGNGPTADATAQLLHGKQVHNRTVGIRRLDEDTLVSGIHAVFIGEVKAGAAQHVFDALAAGSTVLSISDAREFVTQGGAIRLFVEAQRVRFEINMEAAETAQLRISSKLLALAKVVYARKPPLTGE